MLVDSVVFFVSRVGCPHCDVVILCLTIRPEPGTHVLKWGRGENVSGGGEGERESGGGEEERRESEGGREGE